MSKVMAWVLTVCAAGICTGVVCLFSGEDGKNGLLKTVLTLYVLVVVFVPLQTQDIQFSWEEATLPAYAVADNTQMTQKCAEDTLRAQLDTALAQNGLDAYSSVKLESDGETVQVRVYAPSTVEENALRLAVYDFFGAEISLAVERTE